MPIVVTFAALAVVGVVVVVSNRIVPTFAAIPAVVGFAIGRSVVVIAGQNSDEPRPTGGFMGTLARAEIDSFRLVAFDVRNSSGFENLSADRVRAPEPLEKYAGFGAWQMRDANWSPDFPTAAEQLDWFWRRDQDESIDAVVAVNEEGVFAILDAIGPITIEDSGEIIDAANARARILEQLYPIGPDGRPFHDTTAKPRTLGPIANAIRQRLARPTPSEIVRLARLMPRLIEEKTVQIWFRDIRLQTAAAAWGVDGALSRGPGDFLAVIDTSVSYTKIGRYLRSSIDYQASVDVAARAILSTVTITYENGYDGVEARKYYPPFYLSRIFDFRRDAFVDSEGTWATWLRVFVPLGAVLHGVSGLDDGSDSTTDADRTVFGGYARIGPGETRRIRFEYVVENTSPSGTYVLRVHRQGGIERTFSAVIRRSDDAGQAEILTANLPLTGDARFAAHLK
ncbi:MAG: DUF4012 domain-containing protein [Chloroflexota bacterium]|nr:MAG: DUF4012 domain-containing protein [Chloroflexota bacterium]